MTDCETCLNISEFICDGCNKDVCSKCAKCISDITLCISCSNTCYICLSFSDENVLLSCGHLSCPKCNINTTCIKCLLKTDINGNENVIKWLSNKAMEDLPRLRSILYYIHEQGLSSNFKILVTKGLQNMDEHDHNRIISDFLYYIIFNDIFEWFQCLCDLNMISICYDMKNNTLFEVLCAHKLVDWLKYIFEHHSISFEIFDNDDMNWTKSPLDYTSIYTFITIFSTKGEILQLFFDHFKEPFIEAFKCNIEPIYNRSMMTTIDNMKYVLEKIRLYDLFHRIKIGSSFYIALFAAKKDIVEFMIDNELYSYDIINEIYLDIEAYDNIPNKKQTIENILLKQLSLQQLCWLNVITNTIDYSMIPKYIHHEMLRWLKDLTRNNHPLVTKARSILKGKPERKRMPYPKPDKSNKIARIL